MRRTLAAILFLLSGILGLLAQPSTYPCLENLPLHIVILGSSTAAGTGPSTADSAWVNRYRTYLQSLNAGHQVTNLARGGYQTFNLMPDGFQPPAGKPAPDTLRNISAALDLEPDGIIINLPSNDAATGNSVQVQMDNFRSMTQLTQQQGVPVWVCTTQPRVLGANGVAIQLDTRDSIFAYYGAFAIDFWTGFAATNGFPLAVYDSGDGVHLNDAGHKLLFDRVVAANLPEVLQQPGTEPKYQISEVMTERFCAQEAHAISFSIQNLGITDSIPLLLEMALVGDTLLYFSEIAPALNTCESDTFTFVPDLSNGGEWSLSISLRPANASTLIYDFKIDFLSLTTIQPPVVVDTLLCAEEVSTVEIPSTDSLHWYASTESASPISIGNSFQSNFATDTTLWISRIEGPFSREDSLQSPNEYDRDWNGIMIDLVAKENLVLDSLRLPLSVAGAQQLMIRYKSGSYKGSENQPQNWQIWDSVAVSVGQPGLFYALAPEPFSLQAGDTIGFYLHMEPASARMRYQAVPGEVSLSNEALEIQTGTGISHLFGMQFYPRQINVELFYTQQKGYCESRRVPLHIGVSRPKPDLGIDTLLAVGDSLSLIAPSGFSYLWSTGETTQEIWVIPTLADTMGLSVSLQLTDSLGCTGTDSLHISVEQVTSLQEPESLVPTIRYHVSRETAQVHWPGTVIEKLLLMDLQGKTLWSVHNQNPEIMLTYLSPGWYYVRVASKGRWHTLPLWVR